MVNLGAKPKLGGGAKARGSTGARGGLRACGAASRGGRRGTGEPGRRSGTQTRHWTNHLRQANTCVIYWYF